MADSVTHNHILRVKPDSSEPTRGRLFFNGKVYDCALGRGGVRADKSEGDGATPLGQFPLRRVLYRPDRGDAPDTSLPVAPHQKTDGWCDDPANPRYNLPVTLPYPARAERMWRDDGLYDVVVVLGHNDDPVEPGAGSAIFLHLAAPDFKATEGCVAMRRADVLEVLKTCDTQSVIAIEAP